MLEGTHSPTYYTNGPNNSSSNSMKSGGDALRNVLERLENVKTQGRGWTARCPGHADQHNSLCIGQGDDGRVLLTCQAGCETKDVLTSLSLTMRDLFSAKSRLRAKLKPILTLTEPPKKASTDQQLDLPESCTLELYAKEKQLPVRFLQALGLSNAKYMGQTAIRIPYLDAETVPVATRYRTALSKSKDVDNRFRWKSGAKPCLYGLWKLTMALKAGYIVLCEGESDSQTLWYHGIPAIGVPGANNWREEWAEHLEGITEIYIVIEPDKGGDAILKWLANSQIKERARLIKLGDAKDPSELHLRGSDVFAQAWQKAMDEAIAWSDIDKLELRAKVEAAWQKCQLLAKEPDILGRFAADLVSRGFAGETRAAKLVYLAVTSRFLQRPISLAIKGPSSAGKSYTIEQTLLFFPSDAYYALSAMSERALAYSTEPISHRFLVLYETAGLSGNFAQYLVRSLLSEGRVRYETVEKTSQGLRARFIEREGPTGLLLTTTAISWHNENETRLLSVPVADTPEQTRKVLLALADEREPAADLVPEEWLALQEWLGAGEHRVTIPYRQQLAKSIPAVAVRLRRDFTTVLNLVRAHAILHQASRERNATGRIVATMEDYVVVRELVADLVSEGVEATVPESVRETVDAVIQTHLETDTSVSVAQIAKRLKIDKSAASRRVRNCLELGYLRNLDTSKGKAFKLEAGEPLPEDLEILPSPEQLQCMMAGEDSCTVDQENGGITKAHDVPDYDSTENSDDWLEIPHSEPVPGSGVYRFDALNRKAYRKVQTG